MNFDDAVRYLYSLGHETLALKLGLKTTEVLLAALGDPQKSYPAVQIAGTNGKGSTAVVLDSICRAARINTGVFTSPHLVSITERIRVNGAFISRDLFAELATRVKEQVDHLLSSNALTAAPTFFEQVTAIALLAFKHANVDLAILETGLGGRLDSTTVAQAETVGITPIAVDHQEYLGETLEEIAAEKAAIIRPSVTAIIAPQTKAPLNVITERCASVGVTPRFSTDAIEDENVRSDGRIQATLKTSRDSYPQIVFGLRGRHQITNTGLAIELAESLREKNLQIPKSAIIDGVQQAHHPGRLELIDGRPQVLLDGAHNPAGAEALRAYLDEFTNQRLTMLFAAMRDKNLSDMAATLFPRAELLVLTKVDNPRSASLEDLEEVANQVSGVRQIRLVPDALSAIQYAITETPSEGLICVTGSLYLIGEIRNLLVNRVC
ncbi:MAG TPA: folylpolyglutamate synthase/dihydrofolate synthase family protein [Pyrinomonadaceae bacterium]|nr:folylpolyglutamate synthase/dihydrofolate synthase family protein [Pyrinomonadaceae bacterium]